MLCGSASRQAARGPGDPSGLGRGKRAEAGLVFPFLICVKTALQGGLVGEMFFPVVFNMQKITSSLIFPDDFFNDEL